MKKIRNILLAAAIGCFTATAGYSQERQQYGEDFATDNAMTVEELTATLGDDKLEQVVIYGEITQVCQAQGCWLKLKGLEGNDLFVKFRDHAFLVPKDLAGKKAWVFGDALKKIVSVEAQQHYAEDEGKASDEIATITKEKDELRIDAVGVIVVD